MQQQCTLLLLLVLKQITEIIAQGMPTSPCPKMFQYRFDGAEWFGMLSVRDPDHGQPLHLRITLSLRGKPTTDYLGAIELLTRGQFLSDAPVLYKIKFPKAHFPPKLLQITINSHVVCLGNAEQGIFVTQIQLEHTRKFTFIADETALPLTPDFTLPSTAAAAAGTATSASDAVADFNIPSDIAQLQSSKFGFGNKHLPLTKFDSPLLATKDICGTIDNRIRFQVLQTMKGSKRATDKFRSTAGGDALVRRKASNFDGIGDDSSLNGDSDGDDVNNSGASGIPLVTADFSDPYTDEVGTSPSSSSPSSSWSSTASLNEALPSITRGAWPWLAAIYVNNLTSLTYQCGGTLISARIVISSGHCFRMYQHGYTANEVLVFLGRHNLRNWNEEGSIAAPVNDIFIHPDFDSHLNTYDADIAILVLKHTVRFNTFIRPACLWSGATNVEYIEGEHGIVVGWGLSSSAPKTTSSTATSSSAASPLPFATQMPMAFNNVVPRVIDAPIVSHDVCFKANEKYYSLSSNRTFCAGVVASNVQAQIPSMGSLKKPKHIELKSKMKSSSKIATSKLQSGPCTGDSGAGLMIFKNNRWLLRGTVSAALPMTLESSQRRSNDGSASSATQSPGTASFDCNVNQYVIYTDVAKFLDWIFAFII